jgi:4-hydroxybenzoate polyprenyltransferase
MGKLAALIELTRWREYYGKVIFITFLGACIVKASLTSLIILLIANMLNGAFAFMINDVADAEDDALDAKKRLRNPVSCGRISKNTAQLATFIVGFFSLSLYLLFNTIIFLFGLSGIVIGFLYSYRKIRLKSKPFVDFSSHGYFMGLVYFLTAVNLGAHLPQVRILLWLGVPIYLVSVLGSISNQIRDYSIDRKVGLKNSAKFINFQKIKNILFYLTLLLIALVFSFLVINLSSSARIVLIGVIGFVVTHYYFKWYRHKKSFCYYPYNQQILTFMGVLFLLNF